MTAHALYVAAAYGVTAAVLGCLIVWLVADGRAQRRAIAELEAGGVRRRSDRTS